MSNNPFMPQRRNQSTRLQAQGNLTYLEFIRLVEKLWIDSHPDIPLYAMGSDIYPSYPCIVYGLQMRRTPDQEPKPRYREQIPTESSEDAVLIHSQRFQNIVLFSAIAETNPCIVEELIEVFEDFMMEYTPVFKALGLSEIVYSRRLPDSEENRPGQGMVKRTVSYMVTTEKIIVSKQAKLRSVEWDLRLFLGTNDTATPNTSQPSNAEFSAGPDTDNMSITGTVSEDLT